MLGVSRDITEQKKVEEAIREKNEELSATYEEAVATEEALRQNYEDLRSAIVHSGRATHATGTLLKARPNLSAGFFPMVPIYS